MSVPKTFEAIGIDLGTTRSAVAFVNRNGRTEMLTNADDEVFTPSVVLFEGDQRIVGRDALRQMEFFPDRVAVEAKREMGARFLNRRIAGRRIPPEVIQACILRSLRADVVKRLSDSFQTVVTVPAYFDEARRNATINAARIAELPIVDIVNEPTAAALAFGERLGYLKPTGDAKGKVNILVYDLGGGTFDATVVQLSKGEFRTLATDGDMHLGGADWDRRLVEILCERLKADYQIDRSHEPAEELQLRRLSVEAKHTLSAREEAIVQFTLGGKSGSITISREEFHARTADLVERTAFTCRQVVSAAGLSFANLDRVLLVGGSTRMPLIRAIVEELTELEPEVAVNPDEAVARGAAIFAQHLLSKRGDETSAGELTITDVNAHALGIEGIEMATGQKINKHIIPRNTPLPHVVHRKFVTKKEDQTSVVILVLEGQSESVEGAIPLGRAVIRNLPKGLPSGHPIHVEYSYNTNGRLSVVANVPGHGEEALIELKRTRDFSDMRLAAWKQVVCSDGGYEAFEAVLNEFPEDSHDDLGDIIDVLDEPIATRTETLEAAVDHGAPPVAAEVLRQARTGSNSSPSTEGTLASEKPRFQSKPQSFRRKKKSSLMGWVFALGHIVASLLGLAIGYYILVYIRPEANFLNLELPGLPPVESPRADDAPKLVDPTSKS